MRILVNSAGCVLGKLTVRVYIYMMVLKENENVKLVFLVPVRDVSISIALADSYDNP